MISNTSREGLSGKMALVLAVAPIAVLGLLAALVPAAYLYAISKEGPVEWVTVVALLPGIVGIGRLAWRAGPALPRREQGFLWLLMFAGIYFAGEELSWGQHVFGWTAPDLFQQINEKQETNLHNIDSSFGHHLKIVAEVAVLSWAVVWTLFGGRWSWKLPYASHRFSALARLPVSIIPVALMIELSYLPTRVMSRSGIEPPVGWRLSEVQEMYLAICYTAVAWCLLTNHRQADLASHGPEAEEQRVTTGSRRAAA